jgi:hypothetical protein
MNMSENDELLDKLKLLRKIQDLQEAMGPLPTNDELQEKIKLLTEIENQQQGITEGA